MSADMKAAMERANKVHPSCECDDCNLKRAFLELQTDFSKERTKTQEWFGEGMRLAAELEAEREVRHTVENTLTKIQRMSETGTAQSFLKLTDQEKARWFANAVIESSDKKRWQERAAELQRRLEEVEQIITDWPYVLVDKSELFEAIRALSAQPNAVAGGRTSFAIGSNGNTGPSMGASVTSVRIVESAVTQESGATDGLGDTTTKLAPAADQYEIPCFLRNHND